MATRMQQRRGTAAQWTSADPILAAGEIGFESDTSKFKIGDGVNHWSDLSYFLTADDIIDGAPEVLNTLNELAAAIGDNADFISSFNTLNETVSDLSDALGGTNDNVTQVITNLESLTTTVTGLGTDKAPLAGPSFTGTVVLPSTTSIGEVSGTEIAYLNGVTSDIQNQIDGKLDSSTASTTYAPLSGPSFSGTVVLPNTTSIGTVDSTEISYLNGVTSAIQTQLDAKAPTANPTFTGTVSGVTKAHVGLGNVDNTSDANKPISTATQTALDAKASLAGATFTGNVEVDGNLVVDGDLTVNGTSFNASSTTIVIEDNMVQLAHQNAGNTVDLGLVVAYNDGAAKHSGLVRDVSEDEWKLFKGVTTEPTTTVNFSQGSLDNLELNNLVAAGIVFTDGTQTKQGVPSITTITPRTASYTLSNLDERDTIIEISNASATTLTIPTNASVAYPVGTTLDIIQTGSGQVTIAGAGGVTVNATPGLKLRTQWSSATLLKRAENTWLVYGDLTA